MTACNGGVDLTPMQPFGEPHERERARGEGRRMRKRGELFQRNSLNPLVSNSSPRGLLI
jgi:hypothetical protein